jgi:hypothetical protein
MKRRKPDDHEAQIHRLLAEAEGLPHGPTKVELCEEAVRLADLHNLDDLASRAREELVDAASFGGRPDLLIVAFSWCLSKFDQDPDNDFSAYSLLWRMKWVVVALPKFAEIELETIHQMFDDMERRYRDYGGSIQPVIHKRRDVALQTGDLAAATRYQQQYRKMSRSFLSDCHACELDSQASYYFDMGKNAVGLRKAEDLLASGMSCAEVPDGTYADLLMPLVKMRRAADAMKYHKVGYPKVRRSVEYVWDWGDNIAYLALTGNEDRAVKILERHLADVENSHNPLAQLGFFRSALLLIEILADRKEKMRLRLPAESPLANQSGEYVLTDLAKKLRKRVTEESKKFDRRNGNDYYTEQLDELMKLRKLATKVEYNG